MLSKWAEYNSLRVGDGTHVNTNRITQIIIEIRNYQAHADTKLFEAKILTKANIRHTYTVSHSHTHAHQKKIEQKNNRRNQPIIEAQNEIM